MLIQWFKGLFRKNYIEYTQEEIDNMTIEEALAYVSYSNGIEPSWLRKLIQFESGWNPHARNKKTGAGGLIQVMPRTAEALGFKSVEEMLSKYPDTVSQLLNVVSAYFKLPGNRPPYPTPQSLYMTVFYPAARSWSPGTAFPDTVRAYNPGIDTVQDYVNYVERKSGTKTATGILVLLALGLAGYFIYTHFYSKEAVVWPLKDRTQLNIF